MASSSASILSSPIFNGETYQVWAIKMKTYLKALGLWQLVEDERNIQPLGDYIIFNKIKNYQVWAINMKTYLKVLGLW